MKVVSCKVNHLTNPVGFHMASTVFSWNVIDSIDTEQREARILIAEDQDLQEILVDTGWKEWNSLGAEVELNLLPRNRYYWTVSVRTEREEGTSEVQYFETGKREEAWSGQWISCDNSEKRHPYFEKKIRPKGNVKSARLYICGLGLYEAYFNGTKIGDEYLAPFSNDYNQWVQAETYDVTDLVQEEGTLSVLLGNGWYKARFGFSAVEDKGYYGDEWKLIAEVHIAYEDGTEEVIGTDDSWTVRRSQITFSNLYDGEHMDRSLEELPLENSFFTDAPKGALVDRWSLPLVTHEVRKPKDLIRSPKGELILDLGQNFAGIFNLKVHEPKGTVITIKTCEALEDGCFYNGNLRTAKSEYIYVSNGKEEIIRPHFTYYGFRYVMIEGIPDLSVDDFTAYALYSDLEMTAEITTGHELVNQLISNITWGLKSNFVDVPTDCPQRDERMGWTADTQVFSRTACYLSDAYAFYGKYLHDLYEEQQEHGGMVPDVIPSAGVDSFSSYWGDCAVILPWNLYEFYGDPSILKEQYDSMKAWVDFITRLDGKDHQYREQFHYGDWLALDHSSGRADEVKGGTDDGFIADVFYMNSLKIVRDSAKVLNRKEDEMFYDDLYQKQLEYIKGEYYTKSGRPCINTQTACLLTLKYHLSDNEELVCRMLDQLFQTSRGKLKTGFVGTPILCNVLSDYGYSALAYRILLNEEYPGWLKEIKLGATTVWERWNSLDDQGHFTSTDMNSLNHYAEGAVLEWMFAHCAGLQAKTPGFQKVVFAPKISKDLGHLACTYKSSSGIYQTSWSIDEDRVKVSITIPFGCCAEIHLPLAPSLVNCNGVPVSDPGVLYTGTYTFSYRMQGSYEHYSLDTQIHTLLEHEEIFEQIPVLSRIKKATGMFMSYTLKQYAGQMNKEFTEEELMFIDEKLKEL